MPVPSKMADLFTIAASNSPAGSDLIGNSLDDYIRSGFAILRSTNALASASIAAASTTDLSTADGESVQITGAATINSLGTTPSGIIRECRFAGVCTVTNSAAIDLPGTGNITTAAGDVLTFRSLGSGNWQLVAWISSTAYVPIAGNVSAPMTGSLVVSTNSAGGVQVTSNTTASASVYLQNTAASGRNWEVASAGGAISASGNFYVRDTTAGANRLTIDSAGVVTVPNYVAATNGVAVGSHLLSIYESSAGVLTFVSGTGPQNFYNFNNDGSASFPGAFTANGQVNAQTTLIVGANNSGETDISMSNGNIVKWYFAATSGTSSSWALCRTNPSTGAFAESVISVPQSGNIVFNRSCQGPDFISTSDIRLKSGVKRLKRGVAELKKMAPIEYVKGGRDEIGFSAQDAEQVIPEAVSMNDDGVLGLSAYQTLALVASALLEVVDALEKKGVI